MSIRGMARSASTELLLLSETVPLAPEVRLQYIYIGTQPLSSTCVPM